MKTIENKTSQNIENNVKNEVENTKNIQLKKKVQLKKKTPSTNDVEQISETKNNIATTYQQALTEKLRKNVDIIIRDGSRYAEARQRKLSEKLQLQKEKKSLVMYQAANGLRLDNLNGSTSVADAVGNMIRICNNIDKGRCPELKKILDTYGINVATLKGYVRLSIASDYDRYLSKTGQVDYSRAIGAMCQQIVKEYKKNKKDEDKTEGKAAATDKDKAGKAGKGKAK